MKKKLLPAILALAILLIAGFGMNRSMNSYGDLTDMALQNVLALADGENPENPNPGENDGGGNTSCPGYRPLHENESRSCQVSETVTCKIGFKIPDDIPYIGGTECKVEIPYTLKHPGTEIVCKYTGNPHQYCCPTGCIKNGNG